MNDQGELFSRTAAPGRRPWQGGLPDPTSNHEGLAHTNALDTERSAAALVEPRSGTLRAKALDALAHAGEAGFTHEELAEYVRVRHYSIAPRCTELVRDGWIVDSGRRRPTETGTNAVVWVLSERGRAEYDARNRGAA